MNTIYTYILNVQNTLAEQGTTIDNIVLLAIALFTLFIVAYLIECDTKDAS